MRALLAAAAFAAAAAAGTAVSGAQGAPPGPVFSDPTTIDNRYLPLTLTRRCVLRGGGERVVRTVLEHTKRFDVGSRRVDAVVIRDKSYEDGKLVERRDTDVPGVPMPPDRKVGDQWRFEDVPRITTESDRVEEVGMRARVRGRDFGDVIRIQEFVQPDGEVEYKLYAAGVGLIVEYPPDGRIALVGCR